MEDVPSGDGIHAVVEAGGDPSALQRLDKIAAEVDPVQPHVGRNFQFAVVASGNAGVDFLPVEQKVQFVVHRNAVVFACIGSAASRVGRGFQNDLAHHGLPECLIAPADREAPP